MDDCERITRVLAILTDALRRIASDESTDPAITATVALHEAEEVVVNVGKESENLS